MDASQFIPVGDCQLVRLVRNVGVLPYFLDNVGNDTNNLIVFENGNLKHFLAS